MTALSVRLVFCRHLYRQRVRLEYRRDVGGRQRALDQIIYSVVAYVTSRRFVIAFSSNMRRAEKLGTMRRTMTGIR